MQARRPVLLLEAGAGQPAEGCESFPALAWPDRCLSNSNHHHQTPVWGSVPGTVLTSNHADDSHVISEELGLSMGGNLVCTCNFYPVLPLQAGDGQGRHPGPGLAPRVPAQAWLGASSSRSCMGVRQGLSR